VEGASGLRTLQRADDVCCLVVGSGYYKSVVDGDLCTVKGHMLFVSTSS